ncbi:MAG: dihydrolipoyl dehydrogenase [Thermoplasmata archaeon]
MIVIGSGSAVSVVDGWLRHRPNSRGAVIDKDAPGGICLTRGCIPSKLLTSVADVVRTIERSDRFGVSVSKPNVDFTRVMDRLHRHIDPEIQAIKEGLSHAPNLDYYPGAVEFVAPYTLRTMAGETLHSSRILLGLGSEPFLPSIPGLSEAAPLTSDTIFDLRERPGRLTILGGGYIAAEFAHFFAAIGTHVTIVGRNPRFLPREDPEISTIVARGLGKRVQFLLGRQPDRIGRGKRGQTVLHLPATVNAAEEVVESDRLLVATGRGPTTGILHPERAGVKTDARGWIAVNEYLETSQPGIWALGDATGVYPFKHKANYDAKVLYESLVSEKRHAVDYHAVPHAVFTDPEVASVGLTEAEAIERYGAREILVGRYEFKNTAKGEAIEVEEGLVKVLVRSPPLEIVGAHIVGPYASVLLQEVVNLLYTPDRSARPILDGMHIHPALSEVVERAFLSLQPAEAIPQVSR